MPVLANPKHETFARGVANGLKQIDAYEAAGYPISPSSASQLANRPEVRARIQELIEERQSLSRREAETDPDQPPPPEMTREWLVQQLQRNISLAQAQGQISAANKAIEMLADLYGLRPKSNRAGATPNEEDDEPKGGKGDLDVDKLNDALDRLAQHVPGQPK